MARKLIAMGGKSLLITLPREYIKENNLKKGEEVQVEVHGSSLRVATEKNQEKKRYSVDVGKSMDFGSRYIPTLFRQGYDEYEFRYKDLKFSKIIKKELSEQIIGFEIIKQTEDSCVVRDLAGSSADNFDTALSRCWILLLDIAKDVSRYIKENNIDGLLTIKEREKSINKFSNYCIRIINRHNLFSRQKAILYYHFLRKLEEISDEYKNIAIIYMDNQKKDDNIIALLEESVELTRKLKKLFYSYSINSGEKLTEICNEFISTSQKNKSMLYYSLGNVGRRIKNLFSTIIGLKLYTQ